MDTDTLARIRKLSTEEEIIYMRGPNYTPESPVPVVLMRPDFEGGDDIEVFRGSIPWGYKKAPHSIVFEDKVYQWDAWVEYNHKSKTGGFERYRLAVAVAII